MRHVPFALLALVLASNASAVDWSGSLGLTSDYVFRGISQSDSGPAVQGGVQAAWNSGLYIGTWASSVRFPGSDANAEVDAIVGWSKDVKDWSLDVSAARYLYPNESSFEYDELLVAGEWKKRFLLAAGWSPDELATHRSGAYLSAGWRFHLGKEWAVKALVGRQQCSALTDDGYAHAELHLSREWGRAALDLAAHATSSSAKDDFGDAADERVVVGVTWSLGAE